MLFPLLESRIEPDGKAGTTMTEYQRAKAKIAEYEQLRFWKDDAEKQRNQLVVKSNELIQKSRFSLSALEQKIILYIISKIKPEDTELKEYCFDLREMCRVCGISYSGKNYLNFKDSIKALRDKSFWIETPRKLYTVSWIERVEIDKYQTTVSVKLDDRLLPYLLNLRECFTSYELNYTLLMKSKYSIRIYELLKSYVGIGFFHIGIVDLKKLLQCESYSEYKEFRRNVIDKALKEINEFTDLEIEYQQIRENRAVSALLFKIKRKDDIDLTIQRVKNNMLLDAGVKE